MSPRKFAALLITAGVASIAGASAQAPAEAPAPAPNTEFRITKITPEFQDTPSVSGSYNKKSSRPQKWLEIEVAFDWQPRSRETLYTDDLVFTYYILLDNAGLNKERQPTLLTGEVTHTDVMQGRDLHSSIYISPRSLGKFFNGNTPNLAAKTIIDVGVTISQGGQVVADFNLKGKGPWWTLPQYKAVPGIAVSRSETPFAYAAWDYFEPIKSEK